MRAGQAVKTADKENQSPQGKALPGASRRARQDFSCGAVLSKAPFAQAGQGMAMGERGATAGEDSAGEGERSDSAYDCDSSLSEIEVSGIICTQILAPLRLRHPPLSIAAPSLYVLPPSAGLGLSGR